MGSWWLVVLFAVWIGVAVGLLLPAWRAYRRGARALGRSEKSSRRSG